MKQNKIIYKDDYIILIDYKDKQIIIDNDDYSKFNNKYCFISGNFAYYMEDKQLKKMAYDIIETNNRIYYLNGNKNDLRKNNLSTRPKRTILNDYILYDNYCIVKVNNLNVIIDLDDINFIHDFYWRYQYNGYIFTRRKINRKSEIFYLHRLIMNCDKSEEVDHINGNKLDNRKENLRICSRIENQQHMNKRKRKNITSKYKGVGWHKSSNKWRARITVNKKEICIGFFDTEKEAGLAYNEYAKKYHGEYAILNTITE